MGRPSTQKLIDQGSDALKRAVADMEGGFNQFIIDNKKDGFHYIWAAKDVTHPQSVDRMKRIGYIVVNDKELDQEVAPFADNPTTENGAIVTREHVLMRVPQEISDYREKRISEIGHERVQNEKEELKEVISREGGQILNTNRAVY